MQPNRFDIDCHARTKCGRSQAGIALIEALVSILIFTTGILGVIGLQASLTRAQGDAKYRADASALAGELVGAMWSDSADTATANLANYVSTSGTACTHVPCAQWLDKVASHLPKGTAVIEAASTGVVTVRVSWTLPTDGTHTYVTTTSIR
jgi:type IV pilus assembly protein PilV